MTARPQIIAPSILACDFTRLGEECEAVLAAGADWLHYDVMDGHFVPNLSIGLPVLSALRARLPNVTIDAHLMISNPDEFVAEYVEAGADIVTFHPEATAHGHRCIQKIHDAGGKAGIVLNPSTPLEYVDELVEELDMILVMSVNPGFGGQKFIGSTLDKLRRLRERLERHGRTDIDVEVDGGVGPHNVADVAAAGANVFVAGSAIFKSGDYAETIEQMREAIRGAD